MLGNRSLKPLGTLPSSWQQVSAMSALLSSVNVRELHASLSCPQTQRALPGLIARSNSHRVYCVGIADQNGEIAGAAG